MMIRAKPTYQPTTRDLAILAVSLIGVGVGIFAIASEAQESRPVMDFLQRAQAASDVRHVEDMIGAIGRAGLSNAAEKNLTVLAKTASAD